jgi:SET domain-containing protein
MPKMGKKWAKTGEKSTQNIKNCQFSHKNIIILS